MRAAIEHAGAARGLLILSRGDGQQMEAEATTIGDKVLVRRKEAALSALPQSIINYVVRTHEFVILDDASSQNRFADTYLSEHKARSILCLPLITQGKLVGVLYLENNLAPRVFTPSRIAVLKVLASQAATSLESTRLYSEIREREVQEKRYLEQEIRGQMNFEEIVGNSPALERVLQLVETVAPSDSTVLVLGETGTGKELIARAIHDRSRRKDRTFVKVNCAAIPTGLLESELFGHEKGAFTGAISQKIGRLELADQGTLFLDEVGDVPIEIQPKLLRALQEREFERLGSTRTRRVNIRLIAATNRDLEKMIAAREFRSELYYRLNVFPIRMPPLRERTEDIPLLATYFVQKFAKQMQKKIDTIPAAIMQALTTWEWPGNIRELENFMERAVILTRGRSLEAPLAELRKVAIDEPKRSAADHEDIARIVKETIRALDGKSSFADEGETRTFPEAAPSSRPAPLEELEKQHILVVLGQTKGKINGPQGAAAVLKINPNTLRSRMKKLGITRLPHDIS